MRRLLPPLIFLAVAVIGACATSSPIQESVGGGSSGAGRQTGSTGPIGGVIDAGPRACGIGANDPSCNTCLEARCCAEGVTCAGDSVCLGCLSQQPVSDQCNLNDSFSSLLTCLQMSCAGPCGLGTVASGNGGAGSGAGGGGAGGGPVSSTSSSSSSSTSGGSSGNGGADTSGNGSSSSTSGGGGGAPGAGGSASSTSSGGSPTCSSVDGAVGCCDAQGALYFCDTMQEVVSQMCAPGTVCGWNASNNWYDCVAPPGGADPTNTYPIACGQ